MLSVLRCVSTTSRQQFKQTPTMALYDPSTSSPENIRRLDPKDFEDKHSFAEPEKAVVRHISFTWDVDFTKSIIKGAALLTFESYEPVNSVVLDISKDLEVQSAQLEDGKRVPYSINSTGLFGGKLTVSLDPCQPQGRFKLRLNYNTSPAASGLQWLDPEQTSAKVAPFLFSQCQPIHARSVFPCQDTPQVKFTYDAEVTAQAKYTVVMSALLTETIDSKNLTEENCKTFKFHQPIPVASYLVAIAVGILGCEKIGPRSKVYAEPDVVSKAAWEFTDTEKFLATAEKMFGPYVWETYDLLVLPPSFPYGGMENPNLTFVTPTLLAGDRSQADVVIHEIMHSWTGNLVTNKNFENFWLNEGFTVFLERKVIGKIWGSKHRDFESLLGYQELEEALSTMSPESNLTKLVPNLDGIHPDEAYSRVPYEKGSLFLRYLEDLVGGPKLFDDFIRAYVQRFERQSVDSEQFKNFFLKHFAGCSALSEIDWDAWLHSPGAPPNYPVLNAELTKPVQKVINKMYDVGVDFISSSDVKGFSPHQMVYLLQEMLRRPPLELKYLREVGKEFKFTESMNTEIQFRWYRLCILSRDQTKIPEIFEFLTTHGRMKYVRPLYRELYKWPEVREQARVNYFKCEPQLMFLTRQALRTELHLNEDCKDKSDGGCKCGT